MNWSSEQQRLLGAMGYELMVRATPGVAAPAAPGTVGAAGIETAIASSPAAAGGGQAEAFAALRRAVRRAAGEREPGALIADYERLRREPALKRALWPRLRALRRSH